MAKHKLEQSVLDDYNRKYDVYINISFLLHQANMDKSEKDLYDLVMKRAAGAKMMIDYMSKTNILPTQPKD